MNFSYKENKIAKKIFLAYSYRKYVSKQNNMIIIFNYNYYPILFVINNGDDKFTFIQTFSDKISFNKFNQLKQFNNFLERNLDYMLKKYTKNINNFRKAICNFMLQQNFDFSYDWQFLLNKNTKKIYNFKEAKQILINNYDVSMYEIDKITINKEIKENKIEIDNILFESLNEINIEKIKSLMNEIKLLINNTNLYQLLYGKVQIKKGFQDKRVGDYSGDDVIRVNENENDFITIFIHELGHRWQENIMNPSQRKKFKQLYDICNGKNIKLNKNDYITFYNDKNKLKYVGEFLSSLVFYDEIQKRNKIYNKKAIRSIETINGEKINKYKFPNEYSKTKLTEFISVCIQYAYCNKQIDQQLKNKVKEIIG